MRIKLYTNIFTRKIYLQAREVTGHQFRWNATSVYDIHIYYIVPTC